MLNERKRSARRVGSTVTKGKTGTTATDTGDPRLVGPKGQRKRSAEEILKNHSAGPVGKLPDHTVYHDMGYLMAESLGLVSEARREVERARDSGVPTKSTPFKRGGGGPDSVDRARADNRAKVTRHSVNMVGADVEPSEVKKSREARRRGGTKGRVNAAKAVKYLQGSGKTTIKPSTKANLRKKPKPPEYK